MTTELEKEFFDAFGIERKRNNEVMLEAISGGVKSANLSQKPFYEYPQITDRHYLELLKLIALDEGIKISVYNMQDNSKSYKEFGITCLDYFYDEPECNEEDYEPIQTEGTLEHCILKALILIEEKYEGYLKHQVQQLFI